MSASFPNPARFPRMNPNCFIETRPMRLARQAASALLSGEVLSSHGVSDKRQAQAPFFRFPFHRLFPAPLLQSLSPARILQVSRTVLPVAAERRAASRISVTTRLFLSDDSPEGRSSPRTTAAK